MPKYMHWGNIVVLVSFIYRILSQKIDFRKIQFYREVSTDENLDSNSFYRPVVMNYTIGTLA